MKVSSIIQILCDLKYNVVRNDEYCLNLININENLLYLKASLTYMLLLFQKIASYTSNYKSHDERRKCHRSK